MFGDSIIIYHHSWSVVFLGKKERRRLINLTNFIFLLQPRGFFSRSPEVSHIYYSPAKMITEIYINNKINTNSGDF